MQALIEKDWLAFGHPFADRVGMPAVTGSGNTPSELTRQASAPVLQSSPGRHSSVSQAPTSHAQNSNDYSPIFLQVHIVILVHYYCVKFQLTIFVLVESKPKRNSFIILTYINWSTQVEHNKIKDIWSSLMLASSSSSSSITNLYLLNQGQGKRFGCLNFFFFWKFHCPDLFENTNVKIGSCGLSNFSHVIYF